MLVNVCVFFIILISLSIKEFFKIVKIMMRIYNVMNIFNEVFGNGVGKMFFLFMVILYNGELYIFCNCNRKELLELFVFLLVWWYSFVKMEKFSDGCFFLLLFDIFIFLKNDE